MQQFGGHIAVQERGNGQGTTFQVYFPRVDQPLAVAARPRTGPAPRGTETLLVVEDEPSLRHLARSVLELQGYQVLSANNGRDALHAVRDHKGSPIRLVITDIVMPLMGGTVMAEWLKTANPDLKILFTSGYTDDAITQHRSCWRRALNSCPNPIRRARLRSRCGKCWMSREMDFSLFPEVCGKITWRFNRRLAHEKEIHRAARPHHKGLFAHGGRAVGFVRVWLIGPNVGSCDDTPSLTEYQVKALFLLNFIKYVDWPPKASAGSATPITIALFGVTKLGEAAEKGRGGQKGGGGRAIVVRKIRRLR